MSSLTVQNASLMFSNQPIFSDLNFTVPSRHWMAILGSSGIGKSSLLRIIAGLSNSEQHFSGSITLNDQALNHSQVTYMAQTDLLLPWLSVLNNTLLSVKLRKIPSNIRKEKHQQAVALLTHVGLKDYLHHYPHQLSGGMRQRVALARTLLEDKPIVLMDEPFSALDAITRYKLQNLAAELLKNKTVILVTHDPMEALRLADQIYIMKGKPAALSVAVELDSTKPKLLNDPTLANLQAHLFEELARG